MGHILTGILLLVLVIGLVSYLVGQGFFDAAVTGDTGSSVSVTGVIRSLFGIKGVSEQASSTFVGKVKIDFVSLGSATEGYSRVAIKAAALDKPVNMTGWRIETSLAKKSIPQAVDLYGPGARRSYQNIMLDEGHALHIFSGVDRASARVGGKEWHVFFPETIFAFPHDRIVLKDRDGKVVDEYQY